MAPERSGDFRRGQPDRARCSERRAVPCPVELDIVAHSQLAQACRGLAGSEQRRRPVEGGQPGQRVRVRGILTTAPRQATPPLTAQLPTYRGDPDWDQARWMVL
jgi:hypothetical protein